MDERNVNAKMATATSDEIDECRHLVVDASIFHTLAIWIGVIIVQQISAWQ